MSKIKQANWDAMEDGEIDATEQDDADFYELTVLVQVDYDQAKFISDIDEELKKCCDMIWLFEDDGRKQLAYPIKDEVEAYYYFWNVKGLKNRAKFENKLRRDKRVIRYLLIKEKVGR